MKTFCINTLGCKVNQYETQQIQELLEQLGLHKNEPPKKPDLVVSGVNFGRNTSVNILYSGTVAAATEGMLLGIPSIAVSLDAYTRKVDTKTAAEYAVMIAEKIMSG